MDKISNVQASGMMKAAAASIRALSEERQALAAKNEELQSKVAHFEKKERAEKLASLMEDKHLQPELSYSEKVASIMERENLDVLEEAIGMQAPQKTAAFLHNSDTAFEGADNRAEMAFAAGMQE